jgi:hypothetical protein
MMLAALVVAAVPPLVGNDVPFQVAVEVFVAESMRDRGYDISLDQVLDPDDALAVRALGANQWHARELASRVLTLRAGQPSTLRALLWGAMCTDPEVRMRAEGLLDSLYRCWLCKGVGVCVECGGYGWHDRERSQPCPGCNWNRNRVWMCRECTGSGEPKP